MGCSREESGIIPAPAKPVFSGGEERFGGGGGETYIWSGAGPGFRGGEFG
jgi:hypothetical protein